MMTKLRVDENIIAWIDEAITVNRGIVEEDWVSADRAKEELGILKEIKQLLTRQPVEVDEEKIAEHIYTWVKHAHKDLITVILDEHNLHKVIVDAVKDGKQLLTRQGKPHKRTVTRGWLMTRVRKGENIPGFLWSRSLLFVTEVLKELGYEVRNE